MQIYDAISVNPLGDGIVLTPDFWDCECESNFIHHKNELRCYICGFEADDCPDARLDEVFQVYQNQMTNSLRQLVMVILSHKY